MLYIYIYIYISITSVQFTINKNIFIDHMKMIVGQSFVHFNARMFFGVRSYLGSG